MNIWPRFLRFLWEEEATRAPPPLPGAGAPPEATGVPVFLQKVTRWAVIATVGATLTAQIIGVRLIAPVDADEQVYAKTCTCCCSELRKICEDPTKPMPGANAPCPAKCKNGVGQPTPWPGDTLGCAGKPVKNGPGGRSECCKQLQDLCTPVCPES